MVLDPKEVSSLTDKMFGPRMWGDTCMKKKKLNLSSWKLADSQLCLESKTEPSVAKAQNYMEGGGDTAKKKHILGGGTPHIIC